MQIIVEVPQDPTDYVLQGAVIGDISMGNVPNSRVPWFVMQGEVIGDYVMSQPVPSAMIGQHDWYGIKPRTVGPEVMSGGEVVMLDIGQKPANVFVDPIQKWLNSNLNVNLTGGLLGMDVVIGSYLEPIVPTIVANNDKYPVFAETPPQTIPRREISNSGLIKRLTAPVIPDSFGRRTLIDSFIETTKQWFIIGITKDGTGVALGSCRVMLMDSGKLRMNPDMLANPIIVDTTSEVDGTFKIQVPNEKASQLIASKLIPPYVAGLTTNTIVPSDEIVNIYLYDPTTLQSGGSGLATGSILFNIESGEPYIYMGDPLILKI